MPLMHAGTDSLTSDETHEGGSASAPQPLTVLVSGLGLMGASAAAAATAVGHRVLLHHRREGPITEAVARGYGERWQAASSDQPQPDIVVIGAPVSAVPDIVAELAPKTGSALLCDMGSTKAELCAVIAETECGSRFVGAHPMCGSHQQGLAHADATMFQRAACVLTPMPTTPNTTVEFIERFWQSLGCHMHEMSPTEHDAAVARASHVPHVLAAATAKQLRGSSVPLAAGGFRDTSRVAAGDPDLWCGILQSNAHEVATVLQEVVADLNVLIDDLRRFDSDGIREYLAVSRDRRGLFEALHMAALRHRVGEVSYFSSGLSADSPTPEEH